MSHEIRTPMNAIIGLDNIALNDPEVPETTRGYLEKIGSSAEHLLSLINDILDMSRIESGRMTLKNELFSFQKLLEAVKGQVSRMDEAVQKTQKKLTDAVELTDDLHRRTRRLTSRMRSIGEMEPEEADRLLGITDALPEADEPADETDP